MNTIEKYAPLARRIACSFFQNAEDRDEYTQAALLKLHQVSLKKPQFKNPAVEEPKFFNVVIHNLMKDEIVRRALERKTFIETKQNFSPAAQSKIPNKDFNKFDNEPCPKSDTFKELVARKAYKELCGFLPDIEKRILREMIEPSDEFCWFERKKAAVSRMLRKHTRWKSSHKIHPDVDDSLVEFLMITPECYLESINHIRQVFTENIVV